MAFPHYVADSLCGAGARPRALFVFEKEDRRKWMDGMTYLWNDVFAEGLDFYASRKERELAKSYEQKEIEKVLHSLDGDDLRDTGEGLWYVRAVVEGEEAGIEEDFA